MLDDLRRQIQTLLDELLGEADKLRHTLAVLGSRVSADTRSASAVPPRRAPHRHVPLSASVRPWPPRSAGLAPGATKTAVLQALTGGDAMSAGEIAIATALAGATDDGGQPADE